MSAYLPELGDVLRPVVAFLIVSLGVGIVLSIAHARWSSRARDRNVIHLGERRPKQRRRSRKLPQVHPLAWLIGFAVLAYGYMLVADEPAGPGARTLAGAASHVRDGDTIVVSGVPVRCAKLDCAELGTAAGERARQRMAVLVQGHPIQCELTGRRSYDRMIGECDLPDGRSLSSIMIREGYCRRWR